VPFPLTDAQLNAMLEEIPALAGRPRQLEELSGGLTNRNVKVTTPDGVYVARCTDTSCNFLAIDRDDEYHNSVAAERAGVGAPVIEYRPDLGILLLGYLDGKTLSNTDFQRPGVIVKVANGCRALHSGPRFRSRFDMFERQPRYLRTAKDNGFKIPHDYLDYADTFGRIKEALTATGHTTVPCNNDLLAGNFIEDGDRVWIIDYEYSGNNDPCFELGNIWSEATLPAELLDVLVGAYAGAPRPDLVARARLFALLSQYGWTLWASIMDGSSPLDFDFWEWGMQKYERAVATFDGPELAGLLDAAGEGRS
jgi:thiamine kinase-like enzyme